MGVYRVVLCGPSDIGSEKLAARRVVDDVNVVLDSMGSDTRVDLIEWKSHSHPGFHEFGSQAQVEQGLRITDADVVVGIFWRRFGTPIDNFRSCTERELRTAYLAWKDCGRPQLRIYFNQAPSTPRTQEDCQQVAEVLRFKDEFIESQVAFVGEYSGVEAFERQFRVDLLADVLSKPIRAKAPFRVGSGYLYCTLGADVKEIAAEGYTKRIGDIVLSFRRVGEVFRERVLVDLVMFVNCPAITTPTVGDFSKAVVTDPNGTVLAKGRPWKDASLIFENVPIPWASNETTYEIVIRGVRVNANGAGTGIAGIGVVQASFVMHSDVAVGMDSSRVEVASIKSALAFSLRSATVDSGPLTTAMLGSLKKRMDGTHLLSVRFAERFEGAFECRTPTQQGTRLKVVFYEIPSGVGVYVGTRDMHDPESATLIKSERDRYQPQSRTTTIDGIEVWQVVAPSPDERRFAVACWEVERAPNSTPCWYEFPVFVEYNPEILSELAPPGTRMLMLGSLAPNPSNGAFRSMTAGLATADAPVPRYADTSRFFTAFRLE